MLSFIGVAGLIWTLLETRWASRRELRAYMVFETVIAQRLFVGQNHTLHGFEFHPVWKNAGQTPARSVATWSPAVTSSDEHPIFEEIFNEITADIGQGISRKTRSNLITVETIEQVMLGNKSLFLYSLVNYKDIFGERQSDNVCVKVLLLQNPVTTKDPQFSVMYIPHMKFEIRKNPQKIQQ